MKNKKGFGLIGMLISVLVVAILMAAVLKRYAGRTRHGLALPGVTAPAQPADASKDAKQRQAEAVQPAPARVQCDGRQVGNMCIPTEVHSSSLDAFEQMSK